MTNIYRTGQFVWRELMTNDVSASVRFYTEVFGWKNEAMKMPDGTEYNFCKIGDKPAGGIMKPPGEVPPYWSGSVSVTDVDACVKRVTDAGGKVIVPPMDAGEMGRYAGFLDPQGAVANAWRGTQGDGPAPQPGAGEFCWEQLNTSSPSDAFAFYEKVYGWTHKPMQQDASIEVFSAGDVQVASVMQAPPGAPPHWLSYIVVDKLTSAQARAKQQGGKVFVDRIDVPGVGAIGVLGDNVGAVIGIFEEPSK